MRRMIVIASEDIGLRDSSCLPFAIAAKEALEFVGMPEGDHFSPLRQQASVGPKIYKVLSCFKNRSEYN